jgi:saccharopine dehydrogenase-like NADP-dependent oxidoreductase
LTRYAVLGAGMMGRVVARDLVESEPSAEVSLYDRDEDLLARAIGFIGNDRARGGTLDVDRRPESVEALQGHDVAVAALPHGASLGVVELAIEAGTSLVDLVGEGPEARRRLHQSAAERGILVIPGCGVAPGISNFCVGRGMELLDEIESAAVYVGGIPKVKAPPLDYQTVYLLESVFNAYRRNAVVVRGGERVELPPLSGLERVRFPDPIGELEAFYTDGLGSLPLTVGRRVSGELYEKTLRYPGHAEKIRMLSDCGLLSDEPVQVDGVYVRPLRVLTRALEDRLRLGPAGDWLVMRVVVSGRKAGTPRSHVFDLVDELDRATGYTAMARTTGLTAAAAARWIARGRIGERGVLFPEEIFLGSRFEEITAELSTRGVHVRHRVVEGDGEA